MIAFTETTTEAPERDVGTLTDTELLDAMDALGTLFGGDPEEGPEGTEWRLEGYATGSFREAIRQELAQARVRASLPVATAPLLSTIDDSDDLPF